jgi:ParB-like chromosome segregation protein Spo0J
MRSPNHLAKRAPARPVKLLKIVYRLIEELKPDPANPRVHGNKQVGQIASIKTFGFTTPLLIDRDSQVIAGHGRLLACRKLGIAKVPTVRLDHLTPAQARALMIADNQLTINAVWDDRLLAQQLKELSLLDLEFNIEVIGLEMAEIDLRIGSLDDVPKPADDPADARPSRRPDRASASSAICGA